MTLRDQLLRPVVTLVNVTAETISKVYLVIIVWITIMDFLSVKHVGVMSKVLMVRIVVYMESALAMSVSLGTNVTNAKQDTPTSLLVINVQLVTLDILIVNHALVTSRVVKV